MNVNRTNTFAGSGRYSAGQPDEQAVCQDYDEDNEKGGQENTSERKSLPGLTKTDLNLLAVWNTVRFAQPTSL